MADVVEEALRSNVIIPYLRALGVTPETIHPEKSFKLRLGRNVAEKRNTSSDPAVLGGRLDILVTNSEGHSLFVMELKRPNEQLTQEDADQGISYARLLTRMAPFVVLTNGIEARLYDTLRWAPLQAEELSTGWREWRSGKAIATADDLLLRYEALRHFLGYSAENVKLFCAAQRDARMGRLKGDPTRLDRKYVPDLYVPRKEVDQRIAAFLQSEQPIFVLAGPSGTGKTNEMCVLAERLAGDNLVLFFNGAELYGSLAQTLTDEFNWHFSEQQPLPRICERLATITSRLQGRVFIVIDAVDESGIVDLPHELSDLTSHILPFAGKIKIVASLKTEVWPAYARIKGTPSAFAEYCFRSVINPTQALQSDTSEAGSADGTLTGSSPSLVLSRFTPEERDLAVPRYSGTFQLIGSFGSELLEEVEDPFLLRIVAETYKGGFAELPQSVGQWDLLRRYLAKKLENLGPPDVQHGARTTLVAVARSLLESTQSPPTSEGKERGASDRWSPYDAQVRFGAQTVTDQVLLAALDHASATGFLAMLVAHGFLFQVADEEGRRRFGFHYDRVRDYVIAAHVYRLDELSEKEFEAKVAECVRSPIGRRALNLYAREVRPAHIGGLRRWARVWSECFVATYDQIRSVLGKGLGRRLLPKSDRPLGIAYFVSDEGTCATAVVEAPDQRSQVLEANMISLEEVRAVGMAVPIVPVRIQFGRGWDLFLRDPEETAAGSVLEELRTLVREGGLDEAASDLLAVQRALAVIAHKRSELGFPSPPGGGSPVVGEMCIDLMPIDLGDLRRRLHSRFGAEFYRREYADGEAQRLREEARNKGELLAVVSIHYPAQILEQSAQRGAAEAATGHRFPRSNTLPEDPLSILDQTLDDLERKRSGLQEHYLPGPDREEDGNHYFEVAYSDARMRQFLSALF